jgi:hypothetical protein
MRSTMPRLTELVGGRLQQRRHLLGARRVAVQDRGGALGRDDDEDGVVLQEQPVGAPERERPAGPALAGDDADGRRADRQHGDERLGDGDGQAAAVGGRRRVGTGGVDQGDEREPPPLRELRGAAELAVPGRGGLPGLPTGTVRAPVPVDAGHHDAAPAEPRHRRHDGGVVLAGAVAAELAVLVEDRAEEVARRRAVVASGPPDRVPRVVDDHGFLDVVGLGERATSPVRVEQPHPGRERLVRRVGRHDLVDQPAGERGLRGVAVVAHGVPGERLDDARAGEADGRAGVGDDHVGERAVRGVDPARGRVREPGEDGQPGLAEPPDALGAARHLGERDHALLHPRAAGAVTATKGTPRSTAVAIAVATRSPWAAPIEPPRKPKRPTAATTRPAASWTVPTATDSSAPLRSRVAASFSG